MHSPKDIDEYIHAAPVDVQKKLREIRACLREVAPGAIEGLKWGQPAFSYEWILFQFAAFKKHISLYPTPSVMKALKKDFDGYETSVNTIQFPLDKPLPLALIRKIAAFRVKESNEKGIKWM